MIQPVGLTGSMKRRIAHFPDPKGGWLRGLAGRIMRGRFASFLPAEALRQIFGTVDPLPNLARHGTWRQLNRPRAETVATAPMFKAAFV
jgi:hypothetical protein